MNQKNPHAMAFFLNRRSRPAKTLTGPVPSDQELLPILTAAARSPDHGKLEPWRLMVLNAKSLDRLADLANEIGTSEQKVSEKLEKTVGSFRKADLAVAVISSPKPSEKVPEIEQVLSSGAVCLALLNAALASGWGANWLSDWVAFDRDFLTRGLALEPHEFVAGFIHIGTETSPPPERPRPNLTKITTWITE
jgi:nitroreductase